MRKYKNGINIAATLIFEAMAAGHSDEYIKGMIELAARMGAIDERQRQGLYDYLKERGD